MRGAELLVRLCWQECYRLVTYNLHTCKSHYILSFSCHVVLHYVSHCLRCIFPSWCVRLIVHRKKYLSRLV